MCLIKDCYNNYKRLFKDRWIDEIKQDDQLAIETAFRKINDFYATSFILLSKSAISGEYISCENTQQEIRDFINGLCKTDFRVGEDLISNLYALFNTLNDNLLNSLRHYQRLIDISDTKYDNSINSNVLFSFVKLKKSNENKFLSLFNHAVIKTCLYDYRLPTNKDNLTDLLSVKLQIDDAIAEENNSDLTEVLKILLEKCNFIIKKTRKNNFSFSTNSLIKTITPQKLEAGALQSFIDKENQKILSSKLVKELQEDILSEQPKGESFVRLIRHYKECLRSPEERRLMDDVLIIYDEYYRKNKDESQIFKKAKYDNFSLDSIRNYIYNCRFSFLSIFDDISFEEIEREINTIQRIQQEGVQNFHPYEKAIECLRRRIESILNKETLECSDNELNLVERKLGKLQELIGKYSDAIQWCEYRKFYPFLLPFDESNVAGNGFSIFVPSTFSRAIDYKEQFEYLNESKQKLNEYRSLFSIKKEQKPFFLLNQNTQERTIHLEDTVKKYEKRTYELLGLFTAIITFLFGSINIFTQNSDSNLSLLITNTMGLGFILLLFVGLILLTTPQFILNVSFNDYVKTSRFKILMTFIVGYIIILIISYFSYPKDTDYTQENSKEPTIQNNITIPVHNKNLNNKDTLLLKNTNSVIIYEDSIINH